MKMFKELNRGKYTSLINPRLSINLERGWNLNKSTDTNGILTWRDAYTKTSKAPPTGSNLDQCPTKSKLVNAYKTSGFNVHGTYADNQLVKYSDFYCKFTIYAYKSSANSSIGFAGKWYLTAGSNASGKSTEQYDFSTGSFGSSVTYSTREFDRYQLQLTLSSTNCYLNIDLSYITAAKSFSFRYGTGTPTSTSSGTRWGGFNSQANKPYTYRNSTKLQFISYAWIMFILG